MDFWVGFMIGCAIVTAVMVVLLVAVSKKAYEMGVRDCVAGRARVNEDGDVSILPKAKGNK
jgi:hypothetical protein